MNSNGKPGNTEFFTTNIYVCLREKIHLPGPDKHFLCSSLFYMFIKKRYHEPKHRLCHFPKYLLKEIN